MIILLQVAKERFGALRLCRALARWSHLSSQCLDKRAALSLAFNITRVPSPQQPSVGSHEITCPNKSTFSVLLPYRPYATNAVSRPKAHTGRTTSRPRKKAPATKAPAAKSAAAAKKPAAKKPAGTKAKSKAKSKAKPKSKPRTKAKSTQARKKPAKAKKPILTTEQQARRDIKALKIKALTPPKQLPASAFSVLMGERAKQDRQKLGQGAIGSTAKDCSRIYKSFAPEDRERYNHIANQNKATNASRYREWIHSFTPLQINEANNARQALKRRTKATLWPKLKDERLVKRLKSSYNMFYTHRYNSGDFAGVKIGEAGKLIGAEWRGMTADAKKTYNQLAEEDSARYDQEVKAVYNRDVQHKAATAA
ncbi:MAG: hypothetical protein Q9216_006599 [Gyalolechia sp. 2 TL-2023]